MEVEKLVTMMKCPPSPRRVMETESGRERVRVRVRVSAGVGDA